MVVVIYDIWFYQQNMCCWFCLKGETVAQDILDRGPARWLWYSFPWSSSLRVPDYIITSSSETQKYKLTSPQRRPFWEDARWVHAPKVVETSACVGHGAVCELKCVERWEYLGLRKYAGVEPRGTCACGRFRKECRLTGNVRLEIDF